MHDEIATGNGTGAHGASRAGGSCNVCGGDGEGIRIVSDYTAQGHHRTTETLTTTTNVRCSCGLFLLAFAESSECTDSLRERAEVNADELAVKDGKQ